MSFRVGTLFLQPSRAEGAAADGPVLSLTLGSRKVGGGTKPQQFAGGDGGEDDSSRC